MPQIWIGLFLVAAVCAIPFVKAARRGRWDIFEPVYWASAYFAFLFVGRSLYALARGTEYLGSPPFDPDTVSAWSWALIWLALSFGFFLLGYYSRFPSKLSRTIPALPKKWTHSGILLAILFSVAVGTLCVAYFIHIYGGWSAFSAFSREQVITATGITYVVEVMRLIAYGFLAAFIWTLTHKDFRGIRLALPILLAGSFFLGFIVSGKALALQPILAAVIAWHYLKKPVKVRHIAMFFLLLVLIFPYFNALRSSNLTTDLGADIAWANNEVLNPQRFLSAFMMRFMTLDATIYAIRDTPAVMNYQLGKTILPIFVAWIPRKLWPGKPTIAFSLIFANTYFGAYFAGWGVAPSCGILGEGYINFSVFGMFLIAWIAGIGTRTFYEYTVGKKISPGGVLIFAFMCQYGLGMFWEGDIAGTIGRGGIDLLCGVVVAILAGVAKYSPQERPALGQAGTPGGQTVPLLAGARRAPQGLHGHPGIPSALQNKLTTGGPERGGRT